jgi:hypothetical protein
MSDIDDRMEAQEAEYEMGIERELREAEQDGAFTVTEDQEGDRCDSFARELTVALVDMALVQWNDRERCRCVIQQHAARIGELEGERAPLAERIRGIECRHNITSDRRSEPLRQVFEQGYDAALHAAAALVKQVKQPKGDE